MAIDPGEVLRIAALARLKIDAAEAEILARDLERIVRYVDSLREVELPEGAQSLTYFDQDVHREDAMADCLDREAVLRGAPDSDGEFFLVPRIVDREDS